MIHSLRTQNYNLIENQSKLQDKLDEITQNYDALVQHSQHSQLNQNKTTIYLQKFNLDFKKTFDETTQSWQTTLETIQNKTMQLHTAYNTLYKRC